RLTAQADAMTSSPGNHARRAAPHAVAQRLAYSSKHVPIDAAAQPMKPGGAHSSWFAGLQNADPLAAAEAHWEATRAQSMLATQIMNADADEAAAGRRDIGRR